MFAKKTKGFIGDAIRAEYDNAIEHHGDNYRNMNEAWGVLAEEVYESKKAFKAMKNNSTTLFLAIAKGLNKKEKEDTIRVCFANAMQLAMEACQVAAVCQKMLDGVKEWY